MSRVIYGVLLMIAVGVQGCASSHNYNEPYLDRPLLDKPLAISQYDAIYRFSWFRSFNDPYVVRIEHTEQGADVTVRTIKNDHLEIARHRLSEVEWKQFLEFVYRVGFWTAVSPELLKFQNEDLGCKSRLTESPLCEIHVSTDGASWIVEGSHEGHYHSLSDNSPTSGPLYELGLHMLQIANVHYSDDLY